MYEKLQPLGVALGLGKEFGYYSPFAACAVMIGLGYLLSLKILHPRAAESTIEEASPADLPEETVETVLNSGPSVEGVIVTESTSWDKN